MADVFEIICFPFPCSVLLLLESHVYETPEFSRCHPGQGSVSGRASPKWCGYPGRQLHSAGEHSAAEGFSPSLHLALNPVSTIYMQREPAGGQACHIRIHSHVWRKELLFPLYPLLCPSISPDKWPQTALGSSTWEPLCNTLPAHCAAA